MEDAPLCTSLVFAMFSFILFYSEVNTLDEISLLKGQVLVVAPLHPPRHTPTRRASQHHIFGFFGTSYVLI